jgi:hypothetical protein
VAAHLMASRVELRSIELVSGYTSYELGYNCINKRVRITAAPSRCPYLLELYRFFLGNIWYMDNTALLINICRTANSNEHTKCGYRMQQDSPTQTPFFLYLFLLHKSTRNYYTPRNYKTSHLLSPHFSTFFLLET